MVRRSFRLGLRFGILAGIAVAIVKVVQARRDASAPAFTASTTPWPPVPTPAAPASTPTMANPPPAPAPARPEVPAPAAPTPAPAPAKPTAKKAPAKKKAPARAWVEPSGDTCPPSHPVKGKLSSKLFHLPGMFAYPRTRPDRCYKDGEAAEADGLTRAKR